jgi:hypothetical protein
MFIVISDNCESYSDHSHQTILVCDTEDEAKEAVRLLREWMTRASVVISEAWHAFDNRPNKENETNEKYNDGSGYCLDWERYAKDFEPLPMVVDIGCFPYNPGYREPMPDESIKRAIDYMEVPKWARSMQ